MTSNFPAALEFVWRDGFDSPADGYHVTLGDPGGGTFGGVIEATWATAVSKGLVSGSLRNASTEQLTAVLKMQFWGIACSALPNGVDLMLFNGRMMSGHYPFIFQTLLGFIGDDVDGDIGPMTLSKAVTVDPATFIRSLHGSHYAYLQTLTAWPKFGAGWTTRLKAVCTTALDMIADKPSA